MNIRHIGLSLAFMTVENLSSQPPAPDATGMEMDAHTFTKSIRVGWNLGNSFEAAPGQWEGAWGTFKGYEKNVTTTETSWGNPATTQAMIQAVRKAGYNAIRIPVRWIPHVTDYHSMTIDPAWLARVKQVVDWCLQEDLFVVINTHHELWLENHLTYSDTTQIYPAFRHLWMNIATYFRDYDQRLVFAGTNEVLQAKDWSAKPTQENFDVQNGYNRHFVNAVRNTGGRNFFRNLIVQTYRCNPNEGLTGFVIPEDPAKDRLSVEFHAYDPYSYASGNTGCYYYWGKAYKDKGTISPDGNEKTMNNLFVQLRKAWFDRGLGIVLGEYGVSHHFSSEAERAVQEENEAYYHEQVVSAARKNGIAAFVWDNNSFGNGNEKFGIFDRRNGMRQNTPFFVEGAMKGAQTEFQETIEEEAPKTYSGTTFWEGSGQLSWGNGLQLHIPSKAFAGSQEVAVVLYYDQTAGSDYDMIQFCNTSWQTIACTVDDELCDGNFSPRSFYGTATGSHATPFRFTGSSLNSIRQGGELILQGYGVTLTKVLITDLATDIRCVPTPASVAKQRWYNLRGQSVSPSLRGRIYVNGQGKKWLKQ